MKILDSQLPLKSVLVLLGGCATFTGFAFKAGSYVTGRDANAVEVEKRVAKLEIRVDGQAAFESRIDRRLYRIELEREIVVPPEDRIPGVKK